MILEKNIGIARRHLVLLSEKLEKYTGEEFRYKWRRHHSDIGNQGIRSFYSVLQDTVPLAATVRAIWAIPYKMHRFQGSCGLSRKT